MIQNETFRAEKCKNRTWIWNIYSKEQNVLIGIYELYVSNPLNIYIKLIPRDLASLYDICQQIIKYKYKTN